MGNTIGIDCEDVKGGNALTMVWNLSMPPEKWHRGLKLRWNVDPSLRELEI